MEFHVDVQMTVRKNGILPLNVIESIFKQKEIPDAKGNTPKVRLFIDASKDLEVNDKKLLEILGESNKQINRFKIDLKTAYKRNEMLRLGTSKHVYFADPDVLLPADKQVFVPMVRALKQQPRLGAIGLRCHNSNHISTASMMLRRDDLYQIGKIRARRDTCPCNYIAERLAELGKVVIPLKTVRGTHLDQEYKRANDFAASLCEPANKEIGGIHKQTVQTNQQAYTGSPQSNLVLIAYDELKEEWLELTSEKFKQLKEKHDPDGKAVNNRHKILAALYMLDLLVDDRGQAQSVKVQQTA